MDSIEKELLQSAASSFKQIVYDLMTDKATFFKHSYSGIMDFWYRGIMLNEVNYGDTVKIKCLISPYTQLFPGNPFFNGMRWNKLYSDNMEIFAQSTSMQTIAFYIGSDMALRLKPFADNVVVGLYEKYGYVGEGLLATIPQNDLLKLMPYFYDIQFYGKYVEVVGMIGKCPIEHTVKIKEIADKANLKINFNQYNSLPYLKIKRIKQPSFWVKNNCTALLGSPWVALDDCNNPYQVRYGYFSNQLEISPSINELLSYKNINCFFDELTSPDQNINFTVQYMF